MDLYLLRHGEAEPRGPSVAEARRALTDKGRRDVRRVVEQARKAKIKPALILTSPFVRARQTAEFALGERDLPLTLDPGLMEIAHGTWEGLLASEIRERDGDRLQAWRDAPHEVLMPEGESLQHVFDRAWPAFARATEGLDDGDTLLVVAHDAVNRVLLCHVLGIPLSRLWSFRQAPATLNLLEGADAGHLDVVRLNDAGHHTALFGEAVHRAL